MVYKRRSQNVDEELNEELLIFKTLEDNLFNQILDAKKKDEKERGGEGKIAYRIWWAKY